MYKYIYKYINQHVWFINLYPASPNIYINTISIDFIHS